MESLQSVPKTFIVHVIHSSWSSSSVTVDLGKGLVERISTFFLKLNFRGMCTGHG